MRLGRPARLGTSFLRSRDAAGRTSAAEARERAPLGHGRRGRRPAGLLFVVLAGSSTRRPAALRPARHPRRARRAGGVRPRRAATGAPIACGGGSAPRSWSFAADARRHAVVAAAAGARRAGRAEQERAPAIGVDLALRRAMARPEEAHLAGRAGIVVVAPAGLDGHASSQAVVALGAARGGAAVAHRAGAAARAGALFTGGGAEAGREDADPAGALVVAAAEAPGPRRRGARRRARDGGRRRAPASAGTGRVEDDVASASEEHDRETAEEPELPRELAQPPHVPSYVHTPSPFGLLHVATVQPELGSPSVQW